VQCTWSLVSLNRRSVEVMNMDETEDPLLFIITDKVRVKGNT
jgi:hypothetical protein